MRPCPAPLEEEFTIQKTEATDICEHMDLLRELASQCEHVTEMGVRNANGSTIAFLAAQPEVLISWDINPLTVTNRRVESLIYNTGRTSFQPRVGDTLKVVTEPTDMLFIDTKHTCAQLVGELRRHADPVENKVRKYLVFHDTNTYGSVGDDGTSPGLRAAIRWFQREHAFPLWQLIEDRQNNNGLVVLKHAYNF